jgi:hypothetical protein
MTAEETKQLAGLWAMYAAYYRVRIEDAVLRMYAEDLSDLTLSEARAALEAYRKNPKNRQLPMPSQIRDVLRPELDTESLAREIAARIGGAVTKYGWCNGEAARAFIGEVGWSIIERRGGWSQLCQNHGISIDPTAFEAQVREQAKASIKHGEGALSSALGLAPGTRYGELQSIGEIMKSIPGREE